uniref:Peptidylprolyl isomerase n=1 Tax=Opuntia streptacantha TaxID=393608 RepID=A0A7C9CTI1_OPUST
MAVLILDAQTIRLPAKILHHQIPLSSTFTSFPSVPNTSSLSSCRQMRLNAPTQAGPCPDDPLRSHPRQLRSQQAALFLRHLGFWGHQLCEMRRMAVLPGKHTFPFILKACSNLKLLGLCKQVHSHVLKFGLDLDLHVVNGLVRGYSVAGSMGDARQVFDEMPESNLSIWTSMISGYAQNDCSNEALLLFNQMVADGFEPNGATLASVLSACAQQECLVLGERIEEFMRERGIELGVILGTAFVDMYAKNGAVAKAREVFHCMQEKNIATWNAMIHGLAVHGHGNEALRLFQKLEKEGTILNGITFVAALSACCHGGFLEEGRKIFNSMKTRYNIEPQIEHYGCMVDLLGRAGELVEAEQLIRNMAWKADVMIWGALLTACRKLGNIEIAERVVKEIVALDPDNHGVHVVLSNMYAEVRRWEDVLKLRKVMREGNLKKIPGSSLVDEGD